MVTIEGANSLSKSNLWKKLIILLEQNYIHSALKYYWITNRIVIKYAT